MTLMCVFIYFSITSLLINRQSLRDMLETAFTRAERDNDLIYHNTVPSFASLPVLKGIRLAQPVVLPEAQAILGQSEPLFAPLIPWGARVAKGWKCILRLDCH